MEGSPKERKNKGRGFQLVGLALILLGCLLRIVDPYPIRIARLLYFDMLQRLEPRTFDPGLPIRVVDIDENSLETWGQWPWPRTLLAQLVKNLGENGAAAIAFDMLFAEPDRYSPARLLRDPALSGSLEAMGGAAPADYDQLFGSEVARWPVVMGVAARTTGGRTSFPPKAGLVEIGENPVSGVASVPSWTQLAAPLDQAAEGIGSVNVSPSEETGVVRRVPVLWRGPGGVLPGLSIEVLRVAMDQQMILAEGAQNETGIMLAVELDGLRLPTTEQGEIWVRYRRETPDLYIPVNEVLQGGGTPSLRDAVQGRIILVGTSAAGLFDMHQTALGETVPGVSIHAQVIEQFLTGDMLTRSDVTAALELVAFIVLGVVVTVVMSRFGAVASFAAGGVAAAVVLAASWLSFHDRSVLFDATFPLIGGMANFGLLAAYLFISAEREKRAIRKIFAHYVAPEILDELDHTGQPLQLGGETQEITVMFSDIRGFTPLSEQMSATDLVELLNDLFSALGDQILQEQGTIDKFIGDAVMAFWNAPVPVPEHPCHAARAALRMRRALADYNAAGRAQNRPQVTLATGCATGRACVGNIGSRRRFNYTVIGDVVNVAARIEQACRHVDYDILVSGSVYAEAGPQLALLEAGLVDLKGKSDLEPVYALVGDTAIAESAAFRDLAKRHAELVAAIRDRRPHTVVEGMCQTCRDMADQVEPGLRAFYASLPRRSADFRIDTPFGQPVFSHHG